MMNLSDVPLAETQDTGVAGEPDSQVSMQSCGKVDQNHSVSRPEDLKDLENCTRFLGSLRFGDTGLSEVDGLENLRFIDGRLNFFRNSNLVSIDGLMNLETVGGAVFIHHNRSLPNLSGLKSLGDVGDELFISANDSLETLAGLENVQSMEKLRLIYNQALMSLDGLSGLKTVRGDLTIKDNPELSQAEAEAFAARIDVAGSIEVSGNKL